MSSRSAAAAAADQAQGSADLQVGLNPSRGPERSGSPGENPAAAGRWLCPSMVCGAPLCRCGRTERLLGSAEVIRWSVHSGARDGEPLSAVWGSVIPATAAGATVFKPRDTVAMSTSPLQPCRQQKAELVQSQSHIVTLLPCQLLGFPGQVNVTATRCL